MPRISTIQTNFTAGELSPKVLGRVDLARYQNGAESLLNMVPDVYGGAARAPGTMMVTSAKYGDRLNRLIPFVYSEDVAYALEFGDGYMRVFLEGATPGQVLSGGVPYEIASPYGLSILRDLRYVQKADTMFIASGTLPLYSLRRLAHDHWVLAPAAFSVAPFDEVGDSPAVALTLSSAAAGVATATAAGAAFLAGDVGRRITYQGGEATVTAYTSTTVVTVNITGEFPTTALPSGQWVLEDSPMVGLKPSAAGTVGQSITFTVDGDSPPASFRSTDVGKFISINSGLVQITAVGSATSITAMVKQDLSSDVLAPSDAWVLKGPIWTAAYGYPRAVSINDQRLVAGGTTRYPNGVWGSKTGLYLDFTTGDADTDAFFFDLDSDQLNIIQHIASVRLIVPLSYGGEWTIDGGTSGTVTPTDVNAKAQSVYGCSKVKPVRVGNELLFVQRSGRKIRAMAYRVESDSYGAPDLTLLSEHITQSTVVDMAWAQEPGSVLWTVLGNGGLGSLTLDRDESVTAWAPHDTDGAYESICSVPSVSGDAIWVSVKRTINGSDVRYIERMDADYCVHAGVKAHSDPGAATWAGLDHLEGKSVEIVADGAYKGSQVVTGGQITIDRNAYDVEIGLAVRPVVTLLRPEVATGTGTAQGSSMRTHNTRVLFLNTVGAWINGEEVPFRQFGPDVLDQAPQPFSGFKGIGMSGWYKGESPITISQEQPLPFHILSVVRKWTTND